MHPVSVWTSWWSAHWVKMMIDWFACWIVTILFWKEFITNGCMTKYLLKSSPKNEQKQDSDLSSNEIAFQNLIHEINDDLVVHKKVFRMTQLLEKYKAYLPAYTGTYSSAKLQDRLVNHYAGSIVIHTQRGHGMSNLVFSVKLSLGDAISQQVNTSPNLKPLSWKIIFKLMLKVFLMNKFYTLL